MFTKNLNQKNFSYKLKHVFCNDPGCWTCARGKGHGPYWHATYEKEGRIHTVFLGKEFSPIQSNKKSSQQQSNHQHQHKDKMNTSSFNSAEPKFNIKKDQTNPAETNYSNPINRPLPPTRFDFERDLNQLKRTLTAATLKSLYRKLTKKYHPDKYPGIAHINGWMAEINGQYTELKKNIRF